MLLTNHPDRTTFMSLEELRTVPAFQDLNNSQRLFVLRYVHDGLASGTYDALTAVKFAYPKSTKNPKTAKIRAYQLLDSRRIRKVLAKHFRRSELEIILSDLQQAARKSVRLGVGLTPATAKALIAFEAYVTKREHGDA